MAEWIADLHICFTVEAKDHAAAVEAVWNALPSRTEIAPNGKLERTAETRMYRKRDIPAGVTPATKDSRSPTDGGSA